MVALKNRTGERYGILTVIYREPNDANGTRWSCKCDCGNITSVSGSALTSGNVKSCGCLRSTMKGASKRSEYKVWRGMIRRCYDRTAHNYPYYGGRGITVCDRWRISFENFLSDMGPRPSLKHTLDREKVEGNYEKNNCRWVTSDVQANNRTDNVYLVVDGVKKTATEHARAAGILPQTLRYRLNAGYSEESALKNAFYRKRSFKYKGGIYNLNELSIELGINRSKLFRLLCQKNLTVEEVIKKEITDGASFSGV